MLCYLSRGQAFLSGETHPEWVGKVIADLNFELPALAHGTRARIRSCYEYVRYLEEFLSNLPLLTQAYPEETKITAPIETWSDDFSMAIAGIPSMVNDFTGGSFMETHYHSQFDNDDYYDELSEISYNLNNIFYRHSV